MSELSLVNKVFTQNHFNILINKNSSSTYDYIIKNLNKTKKEDLTDNFDVIHYLYNYMAKNYRNEYFYQNTLFNKLLLGKHSLNTTTAISQLPINTSIADFILINGKAVVYEIKTELDSFARLDNQINNYYKAFNNVVVVTSNNNLEKLQKLLENTPTGIYVLSNKNTLQQKKPIIECNYSLDHTTIFNILRKKEFENIILNYFGYLPTTSQVFYYDKCLDMIKDIKIDTLYSLFTKQLKLRNIINQKEFEKVPYELKSLVYFSNLKNVRSKSLLNFLHNNIGG